MLQSPRLRRTDQSQAPRNGLRGQLQVLCLDLHSSALVSCSFYVAERKLSNRFSMAALLWHLSIRANHRSALEAILMQSLDSTQHSQPTTIDRDSWACIHNKATLSQEASRLLHKTAISLHTTQLHICTTETLARPSMKAPMGRQSLEAMIVRSRLARSLCRS